MVGEGEVEDVEIVILVELDIRRAILKLENKGELSIVPRPDWKAS